jgi:hypothetical protein
LKIFRTIPPTADLLFAAPLVGLEQTQPIFPPLGKSDTKEKAATPLSGKIGEKRDKIINLILNLKFIILNVFQKI